MVTGDPASACADVVRDHDYMMSLRYEAAEIRQSVCRLAAITVDYRGVSITELAKQLGVSRNTAQTYTTQGRALLRAELTVKEDI